ncbi:MAG: hypothetical protein ACX93I_10015 [Winogradskyella sp.]
MKAKNYFILLFIIFSFLWSCKKSKKQELSNVFYESGELKEIVYSDSLVKFYKNGSFKEILIKKNDSSYLKIYNRDNNLISREGLIFNNNEIGWWKSFNDEGNLFLKEHFFVDESGQSYLNQYIVYSYDQKVNYDVSYFHTIDKNTLKYFSPLDTLNLDYGKKRFIVLKAFHNNKSVEFFFNSSKELILNDSVNYDYGIIEETVFLETDSIINGENMVRIIEMEQNIDKQTPAIFN